MIQNTWWFKKVLNSQWLAREQNYQFSSTFYHLRFKYCPNNSTFLEKMVPFQWHILCKNHHHWTVSRRNMTQSQTDIFDEVRKCQFFALFWHILPTNFCKPGLNDLKTSGRLLPYEFCMIQWELQVLWHPSKKMFFLTF